MSPRIGIPSLVAVAALVVAGCGGGGGGQQKTTTTAKTEAEAPTGLEQPKAKVSFTSPQDGATTSGTVNAKVQLTGIELSPQAVGKAAKAGEGHLHFSLDEGKYDFPRYSGANGELAEKLGVQGKYSPSVAPSITYRNLPPGSHELEVYVANNDHTDTGAEAKVEFTVK